MIRRAAERVARGGLLALLATAAPGAAFAQPASRLSASVGVAFTGSTTAGRADARETTSSGGGLPLFTTETTLEPSADLAASLGVRLTRGLQAEVSASYGRVTMLARIRSDAEGVPDAEAETPIDEVTLQGSLVVYLPVWRALGSAFPFVAAGGGYLRHVHEGRTLAESGATYHLGGGVELPLSSSRGVIKSSSLRLAVRAVARSDGALFDDKVHVVPSAAALLLLRF